MQPYLVLSAPTRIVRFFSDIQNHFGNIFSHLSRDSSNKTTVLWCVYVCGCCSKPLQCHHHNNCTHSGGEAYVLIYLCMWVFAALWLFAGTTEAVHWDRRLSSRWGQCHRHRRTSVQSCCWLLAADQTRCLASCLRATGQHIHTLPAALPPVYTLIQCRVIHLSIIPPALHLNDVTGAFRSRSPAHIDIGSDTDSCLRAI